MDTSNELIPASNRQPLPIQWLARKECQNIELKTARKRRWSIVTARASWYARYRQIRFSARMLGLTYNDILG